MKVLNYLAALVAVVVFSSLPVAFAAGRGGGGGGGGGRPAPHNEPRGGGGGPGGPSRGGAPHSSGGIGGGLSPSSGAGRKPEGGNSFGGSGAHGGNSFGASERPGGGGAGGRPGAGAGGVGGPASGVGVRPGAGAGGAGGPASGVGVRPGAGAGGAGGPASGVGVRPGAGAGGVGVGGPDSGIGVRPGAGAGRVGVGGPDSGIGALPGAGAGRAGVPRADEAAAYGTRYRSTAAVADQAAAVRAVDYRRYDASVYAAHANAWAPVNLTTASVYTHPGYNSLAVGLKLGAQAVPYDYGGNVVMQQNAVYVDGVATSTPQEYAQQASTIAAAGQTAETSDTTKWLPLGVFALVEGDATSSDDVFQLAVNHDGIIRGNYHQLSSDAMEAISGSVDRQTQRAAWTIGKDKMPVYDAGIANLTKDSTPILIHLEDGQTRQLTLVRLEQPAQ